MPRYRRATRAGNGKNASQTCICKRVATQVSCECHVLLDHGPIDIPDVEVEATTLQSIHCGLPASWTRARRHPPPPRPQSPRAVEAGARFFSIGLGSNASSRSCDAKLPAWEFTLQISSEADLLNNASTHSSSSTENMVRMPGWIDAQPVTNRQFQEFVNATRHITFAEIPPDPDDYPGTLPHMLFAGSLAFTPPKRPVDLRDWSRWWTFMKGAGWRRPYGPESNIKGLDDHPVVYVAYSDALAYATRAEKNLPTEAEREFAARGGVRTTNLPARDGKHLARRIPNPEKQSSRAGTHLTGQSLASQWLWRLRHNWQCLGVDDRLVFGQARTSIR